jgi:hypothetical protein
MDSAAEPRGGIADALGCQQLAERWEAAEQVEVAVCLAVKVGAELSRKS